MDSDVADFEKDHVELAIIEKKISKTASKDALSPVLGGSPSWLTEPPSLKFTCKLCGSRLFFLVQFENSLEQSLRRVIYVFVCNTRSCSHAPESWLIFAQHEPASQSNEEIACKIGALSLKSTSDAPDFNCFNPGFFLYFEDEQIQKSEDNSALLKKYKVISDSHPDFDAEKYESQTFSGFDKNALKFQRKVANQPKQCIRISSEPLLFEQLQVKQSHCSICGASKLFEFQLMPAIFSFIPTESFTEHVPASKRSKHILASNGMEWVTVLFYTCPKSCQNDYASVVVQTEKEFDAFF